MMKAPDLATRGDEKKAIMCRDIHGWRIGNGATEFVGLLRDC